MATDPTAIPLANGFEPETSEWERAAAGVLRKTGRLKTDTDDAQVWEALSSETLDDITVPVLGTPRVSTQAPALPGQAPYTRGATAMRPEARWDTRAHFADPDRDRTIDHVATDLENGVNSLWLRVGDDAISVPDLPAVLEPVFLDLAPVVLDAPHDPVAAATAWETIISDKGVAPASGTNLGADPIGASMRHYGLTDTSAAVDIAKVAARTGTRAIVVDGTAVHDAGATDVQELAYSMAAAAGYLRLLTGAGYDVDAAAGLLEFRYAVTDEQFPMIAKLRAARTLWNRVCELSSVSSAAAAQHQHAVTSRPMMTRYDSSVNLVRTMVAALSAGVGGAASITVLPFDDALGLPERFSRRTARNISNLLICESQIGVVTDPAGGAHAVERLTDDFATAAWHEFGRIEESGGIAAAISDGSLAGRISESSRKRDEQIAVRSRPLTGISEFPASEDELPSRRPAPGPSVRRYAEPFERLRDQPPSQPVFLATMGSLAAYTARTGYATNVFVAGGVTTIEAGDTEGVDDVLAQWRSSGAMVVCLCGNDSEYERWGSELIEALRNNGVSHIAIAGKTELDVDDAVYIGANVLEFLHRTRRELEAHA